MKFVVTMKDPDTLDDAIDDAVKADVAAIEGLSDAERDAIRDVRRAAVRDVARTWFEYGEYLCVEIDTEACTATVLPVKR